MPNPRRSTFWALLAASLPMFMGALDNLVVTTALSSIAADFQATQAELQWVVNGYTLPYAGTLLAGAVLGDRIGRRRVFVAGIVLFTLASAACALAPSIEGLVAARLFQGAGAGLIMPVSLTLAVAAVDRSRRNLAVGVWGAVNGIGIAVGPLAGGLVTEGLSWDWIFWLNVPIGLIAIPLVRWAIPESRGDDHDLNVANLILVVAGVVAAVWGIVQAADHGWTQPATVLGLTGSVILLIVFAVRERRAARPLIPLRLYRSPAFMLSNGVALAMYFGVFGAIFFLAQLLQGPMALSPLQAGVATLPWTAAPMIVVPLTAAIVDRVGAGVLQAAGLALQGAALAWIAVIAQPGLTYPLLLPAMIAAGIGMGLVFGANPAALIASVRDGDHNKASGVNSTVREFGGALGVAVLATVFTQASLGAGGAGTPDAFLAGLRPALWLAVAVCLAGALLGLLIRRPAPPVAAEEPVRSAVEADRA